MSSKLPKYTSPPVVETVLSVQFRRLEGFTSAHAGSYWSECLGYEWDVREVDRLEDVQETFGKERAFVIPGFQVRPASEPNRVQFRRGARMVQVQDSRFIYNWIRSEASPEYPTFVKVLPEFAKHWADFKRFLASRNLPKPAVNQWEVTYVNLFERGGLWSSFTDITKILRDFCIPASDVADQEIDSYRSELHYELGEAAGRLRVSLAHGRTSSPDAQEGLSLKLTARGPLEGDEDLPRLLDFGHEAIVRTFTSLTTDQAHKHWGRTA